jgi:N-acetylmuramoyl-L-alanine amidase
MDVILHCSNSKWGNAVTIDGWHAQRGFNNGNNIHIGYHYVILNGQLSPDKYHKFFNGSIETGRPLDDDGQFEKDETAAATLGKNDCVQICIIGETGAFTIAQMKNCAILLRELKAQYGTIKVSQHSDFDKINRPYCAGFSKSQMEIFNTL